MITFPSKKCVTNQTGQRRLVNTVLSFVGVLLFFLFLFGGAVLLPSRLSSHAASPSGMSVVSPRCAEQPIVQNCQNKDPLDAHCTQDTQTTSVNVVYRQQIIGRVDMRASALCQTAWTRVIAFPGTPVAWVDALTMNTDANTPRSSGNDTRSPIDGTLSTYTNMVYSANTSSSGQFMLFDGTVLTQTV